MEGTIIGPVLEVQIVKILDGYGIEIAIPSIDNPVNTSYVVISTETQRFLNETHDHKDLRSSDELLTAERGSNGSKETCAPNSSNDTAASPPSNPFGGSLLKRTVIPGGERKLNYD